MAVKLPSLLTRTLSALVLIPVVIYAVVQGSLAFKAMIVVLAIIAAAEWIMMARKTDEFVLALVKGLLYLSVGFFFCVLIRLHFGIAMSVLFLIMVWMADIGGYVYGKLIGGPKLVPLISPNKTWAGLLGAITFSIGFGLLFYFASPYLDHLSIFIVVVVGFAVALVDQAGDLLVSMMKRRAGLKDTGALIPGHGGLLDRIDGLLAAAPAFYVLIKLMGGA